MTNTDKVERLRELLRPALWQAFDTGRECGFGEATAEEWGSVPSEDPSEVFDDLFAEWNSGPIRDALPALLAVVEALETIANIAGNIPDERLETRSGPNDAAHRGVLLTGAREIARTALATLKGEG